MQVSLKSSSNNMNRTFWRYAIPSIAAMLVNGVYQVVDGIFIGHYIGQQGLASVSMVWPIIYVIAGLGLMIGMGAGSLLSMTRGQSEKEGMPVSQKSIVDILCSSSLLMVVMGFFVALTLMLWGRDFLKLQGGEGEVLLIAEQYLSLFIGGGFITILASAMPIFIRNNDAPTLATTLLIIGALLNIILDYLFIVQFDLGLKGAAIATLSAQFSVCIGGIFYFLSKQSNIHFKRDYITFNFSLVKKIVLLGASSLVMYLYVSFVFALHNRLFMQYGTTVNLGAFAIVGYLMVLYYLVAEGLAEGMQPLVSFFHGASQPQKIKAVVILSIKATIITGLVWIAILNIFPHTMIGMFNDFDEQLIQEATLGIRLHLFAMFLDGIVVLASMYFMAVGLGGRSLWIAIGNLLTQLPLLYFLPKWFGITGIWLVLPLSTIIMFIVVVPMLWRHCFALSKVGPKKKLILQSN
ncbi:MATE family efflux transporter [uncultured Shewanella sp.]|uniref:MATE family efflux transporter n=1 Tax=uncultured Shewanella sp. TaxID=173975 RepID=UPI002611EFC0|nr:MATE family efflux transporter [uncultured Shewanella sp.]